MASSDVRFEIAYKGSYYSQEEEWGVSLINVKFTGTNQKIFSYIDTDFKIASTQILDIKMRSRTSNDSIDFQKEFTCACISVPLALAKTIKLSIRIFQTYIDSCFENSYPDQGVKGVLRTRYGNLSIALLSSVAFEEGKYYRIQVENEENKLYATFVPIDAAVAQAERREQKEKISLEGYQEMEIFNPRTAIVGNAPGRSQELQGLPYLLHNLFPCPS